MPGFLGNESLKDINVKIQWTKERLEEYQRCYDDPDYFISHYVKIVTLDEGIVTFEPWDFQRRLINTVNLDRFTICKMPRQSGKSTTIVAYFLWYLLFNKHKRIGILANKRDLAVELLSRLQLAFELLPQWLQQGVKIWNKTKLSFENGCEIQAHATSGMSVRGQTFNIVLLDEFAHIEAKLADKFWTSTFPVISSGTTSKVIIVSTPNGMNLFYDLWEKAILEQSDPRWNKFTPVEVHYTEVPGREKPEWADQMLSILGQERFDQEFGCEFLGSGSTLISGRFLKTMVTKVPLYTQNHLDVYEEPKIDVDETGLKQPHVYVIAIDTGRGKQLDYSAFTVIDVSNSPYNIVAKYRSNEIVPVLFADVVVMIARRYNNAFLIIEVDGPGYQVADDCHHNHEYENIFTVATKGRSGQILVTGFGNTGKNVSRGVKMSPPVRRTGCMNLKTLLETKRLITLDHDIRSELTTFSLKGEKYEAEEGKHDDLVMTLVTFSWLTTQKHFRDMMESKIRQSLQMEFEPQMDFGLVPFGATFIQNGLGKLSWCEKGRDQIYTGEAFVDDEALWTRVGNESWTRFEEEQLRKLPKHDNDAFVRLSDYYGWT
jgi:hypothetical protein